jgi:tetratricopeptide (TPR) repeat protein
LLEDVLKQGPSLDATDGLAAVHFLEAVSGWSPSPLQDLRRAKQLIDAALTADSGDPRAQALRGALLRLQKKPADALAAYEAATAADPNLADAYAEIGRIKIDLGRASDALPAIEKALELSPHDPQRFLWLSFAGMAQLYAGRPKEAVPWLEKSAALRPSFINAQIWLAAAHQLAGDSEQATAAAKAALKLSPSLTIMKIARQIETDNPDLRPRAEQVLAALRQAGVPE